MWLPPWQGGALVRVKSRFAYNRSPMWSPDGRKIVFTADPAGFGDQIFTIGANGRGLHQLTRNRAMGSSSPAWSPSGKRIVFSSPGAGGRPDLYVIDSQGRHRRRLTRSAKLCETLPAWSPDGTRIAFLDSCGSRLYVLTLNGRRMKQIASSFRRPSWSPDGKQIAFARGSPPQVRVINANGSGERIVTSGDEPAWSPDGRKIVFAKPTEGGCGPGDLRDRLYVVNVDGTGLTQVTKPPRTGYCSADDSDPDWQPLRLK